MSRGTNSILSEIEWDEGLSMPVANSENKALEDKVILLCCQLKKKGGGVRNEDDRCDIILFTIVKINVFTCIEIKYSSISIQKKSQARKTFPF